MSKTLPPGGKKLFIERPRILCRIFFSIRALADQTAWYQSRISFDDPLFHSYYVIDGPAKYFEANGEGIFQGDVWVFNESDHDLQYVSTEILV